MSHFTHLKTTFHNLLYLEEALNFLNIKFQKQQTRMENSTLYEDSLKIFQSNGSEIDFVWNGQEYEIVVDMSFWEQSSPITMFMEKLANQYATRTILGESQKLEFKFLHSEFNLDGSNLVTLERYGEIYEQTF